MQPLSNSQRLALLAVLEDVLVYARSWTSTAGTGAPLAADRCAELNRLFGIVHNVPSIVAGTYVLWFDEKWFVQALASFDRKNGTTFAQVYREAGTAAGGAA